MLLWSQKSNESASIHIYCRYLISIQTNMHVVVLFLDRVYVESIGN